jgi:flagellar biogenesis protein FliO
MPNRVRAWFQRQPTSIKLVLAIPLLLVAVVWSTWTASDAGVSGISDAGARRVLSRDAAPASTAAAAAVGHASDAAAAGEAPAERASAGATAAPLLLPHEEPRAADNSFSWGYALRTVLSVGLVIALIVVCGRVLKYFMTAATQPSLLGSSLRVVETTYLPAPSGRGRAAIHLMEMGDRLLLVGATDAHLTLLTEFDKEGTVAAPQPVTAAALPHDRGSPAFAETLRSAVNGAHRDGSARHAYTNGAAPPATARAEAVREPEEHSFGEVALADMLRRMRRSKDRLEARN